MSYDPTPQLIVRLSYPSIFTPAHRMQNPKPEDLKYYQIEGHIDPNDPDSAIGKLFTGFKESLSGFVAEKFPEGVPKNLRNPIRSGDKINQQRVLDGKEPRPDIEGKYVISFNVPGDWERPKVFNYKQEAVIAPDPEMFHPGCYVALRATFFVGDDYGKGKSVGCGYQTVMFYKDGPHLGKGPQVIDPKDAFAGITGSPPERSETDGVVPIGDGDVPW